MIAEKQLKKIQQHLQSLDEKSSRSLDQTTELRLYKRNEYLLRARDVCKSSFQLIEGLARKFYLNDGKEITTEFYFADDLAVSLSSYTATAKS